MLKGINFILLFVLSFSQSIEAAFPFNTIPRVFSTHKNYLKATLLGPGAYYSLQYEHLLLSGNNFKTSLNLGLAWYPPNHGIYNWFFPCYVSEWIKLKPNHYLTLGTGITAIHDLQLNQDIHGWRRVYNFYLGYRHENINCRFFQEVNYLGIMNKQYLDGYVNWLSFGIGFHF